MQPICLIDLERYKKFGRLFGAFEQGKPCIFVAEPDLIKEVLVKDFQHLPNRVMQKTSIPIIDNMIARATVERWRPIRTATSPAYSTAKLRKMTTLIHQCAMTMSSHLKEAAEGNEDVDLRRIYGHYSLDVIARCAFGTRIDSHADSANAFVTNVSKLFAERRMSWRVVLATSRGFLAAHDGRPRR